MTFESNPVSTARDSGWVTRYAKSIQMSHADRTHPLPRMVLTSSSLHLAERRAFALLAHYRKLTRMDLLDAGGTGLKLRNLRSRIERGIRQLINCQLLSPMIRNEDRVG